MNHSKNTNTKITEKPVFYLEHLLPVNKAYSWKVKIGRFFEYIGYRITFMYDVFQSIVPVDGGYLAFFRRFNLNGGKKSFIYSRRFDENFKTAGKPERIDEGEDPRVFVFRGEVYSYFYKYLPERSETESYLFHSGTKKFTALTIEDNFFQGKNWIPFEYRNELYFIYSLEPLRILTCNIETGHCTWFYNEKELNSTGLKFGDEHLENYTIIGTKRGGTQGEVINNRYVFGFGHETAPDKKTRNHHVAFLFILDIETFKMKFAYPENINTKGLNDPCSFFIVDDDIFLAMTVSEDDWWFHQNFSNTIQVIKNGVNVINQYIEYLK